MRKTVKMLQSVKGQDRDERGIAVPVQLFRKGETYDLCGDLAEAFLRNGLAEDPLSQKSEEPRVDHGRGNRRSRRRAQNKMLDGAR